MANWTEDFEALKARMDGLWQRVHVLDKSARAKAERQLRELDPSLPTEAVFHYAHNWLCCGADKHKARKADYIIKSYWDYVHRLKAIVNPLWYRWHDQLRERHNGAN